MRNGFKKITALLMAALMLLAALPAGASGTEQYSNKVLPGISLASILPSDTDVVTYVFMKGTEEISRQSVKNGDTLVEPEVTTGPNEKFVGWAPAVTFGTVSDVTETKTITVNAVIENVYHVFFADESGRVVVTREGKTGDTIDGFDDVTNTATTLIPLEANKGISGWKNANGETVTSVTLADSDVTLTAIIENGYWITFESNGGSYVAPMFFTAGQTASAPETNPTKPGFAFVEWYIDEALTTVATFANIKSNKTLYAGWRSTQVPYTVIHWWENANDANYSYHESETLHGYAGDLTDAKGKTYTITGKNLLGQTVSDRVFTAKAIQQQTIKGDGSTIVNVYYERKQYTLHFKDESNSRSDVATITKKWGADISKDEWPTYYFGDYHEEIKTNSNWQIVESSWSTAAKYLAFTSTMPMTDGKLWKTNGANVLSAQYMVESLDGETYILHHTDTIYGGNNTIGEEDKYAITGFTYSRLEATYNNNKYYFNGAKFYYTRNSYKVVYYNGTAVDKEQPYKYEADISKAGDYRPANPPTGMEGYVFGGWYADPTCTVKYEFDGKKMPADNIIVYAKWIPPVYTVTVFDADKATVLDTFEDIPKGNTISEANMPLGKVNLQGGEFLGWVDKDTEKPFHFDTQITKDYNLYAKVGSKDGYTVAYNANGGSGTVPTDATTYAVGSSAVVQGKGEMVAPANEPDKSTFLGWAKMSTAKQPDYLAGESMEILAADAVDDVITLYAVWGPKPATTTLTYNANFGDTPATKPHTLEDGITTELPNNATVSLYGEGTFTRPGYKLIGWANNDDAAKPDYALGEKVIVDNSGLQQGEANVLYAVWEKATVTLTIKKVVAEGGDTTKPFTFTGSYTESGATTATNFEAFSLKNGETKEIEVPIGAELTIVESDAASYTTSATYGSTPCTVADNSDSKTITGITVDETNTQITVTNTIKTGKLVVKKNVTGGWGDKEKLFAFTYQIGSNDAESFNLADTTKKGNTFELKDLPYGTVVTITETDYSSDGYTTTNDYDQNGGNTATVIINADKTTVTFTNHKEANPDTGVLLDSLPYILILAAIAVIVGVVVVRKRHSRDDD